MERLRYFAIGTVLSFALTTAVTADAQQSTGESANAVANGEHPQAAATQPHVPSVDQQMKVLTEKLDLTADQQAKLRPVVQRLHDYAMKLVQDPSLSHGERVARFRQEHLKAHDEFESILTQDQKQKLEAYMQEGPHPEFHWNLGGAPSTQPQ